MSLSDLVIETRAIQVGGEALFRVRGLCFNDITILLREFQTDLDQIVSKFTGDGEVDADELDSGIEKVLVEALGSAPAVVAKAIALAADEPELADKAIQLPLPVQVDALEAIWALTVDSAGGVKKLLDSLVKAFQGVATLSNSIGTSA